MNRQVKRSSLALLLGTLALTGLAGPALAGDIDGALKYVPADFTTVVAIDLDAMRGTPLFDTFLEMANDGGDLKALKQEAGFDPAKDLATMVFAGPADLMKHEEQYVVVVGGHFDAKRVAAFIEGQGDKPAQKTVGGATVYTVDREFALAIDQGFVIGGAAALVDKALAAKAGKNVTSGRLGALIKRFKGAKGGFAVIAADAKVQSKLAKELPDLGELESAGLSLDFSAGLAIKAVANFASAKAAAAVVEGLTSAFKEAAQDPDLKEMGLAGPVSKTTAKANGKAADLALKLDLGEVKRLVAILGEQK